MSAVPFLHSMISIISLYCIKVVYPFGERRQFYSVDMSRDYRESRGKIYLCFSSITCYSYTPHFLGIAEALTTGVLPCQFEPECVHTCNGLTISAFFSGRLLCVSNSVMLEIFEQLVFPLQIDLSLIPLRLIKCELVRGLKPWQVDWNVNEIREISFLSSPMTHSSCPLSLSDVR